MYRLLLALHSWDRWIVLLLGIALVGSAMLISLFRRGDWGRTNERLSLFFIISADIQLLLGIGLYALTPYFSAFTSDPGAAMGNAVTRFWAMEHGFGMIVAIVLAHVGRIAVKKAQTSPAKAKRAAWLFGIAVLIMLITTPWPFMEYGRPLLRF
jgi:predicted membrane channel-forming protein YqfA (hemolysin III family)